MSQVGQFSFEEAIETLTGNTGDIVHPQVGNINIVGVGDITVNGNNTTGTLTITQTGSLANTYTTDSGNAAPVAGTIRILGGNNLNTAGTGNTVTVHLDDSIVQPVTNASGTQGLYSLGANRFMHGIGTNNTFLGSTAGNLGLTVATSVGNVGLGSAVLTGITSAAYNVGVGASALTLVTTGVANTAVGALAGSLMNGSGNTLLGKEAGISYVGTESYNIIIGNSGTAGESNKIRIGTYGTGSGQQDTAYIAGNVHGSNGLTADSGNIVCTAGDISASTGNIYATAGYIETVDNDIYIGDKTVNITGPDLQFKKSRNGAVISAGDVLGNIKFSGYDGTSYDVAAQITSLSSGSIGTGRIAADLQFWTSPDVAGIALRRMDVKPTGEVYIYTPDSGVGLTIQGRGETITAGNLDLTDGNIYVDNPAVSSDGSDINFRKSRASATVANADNLGNLVYWGHDGANYIIASAIISNVTATPATNKIPSNLEFWTHPDSTVASTKRVTIESAGTVTVNAPDSGNAMNISGNVAMLASSPDHIATVLDFKKSHGGALISAGDELGNITFQGYDGANYVIGAAIIADTNGTPGTNRIPTQLQFWTHPDSTTAALQRLTIASTGEVTIATPDSGTALTVTGAMYVTGIAAITVSNAKVVTVDSSTGQIGALPIYTSQWSEVTGTTQAAVVNNGYITNNAALVTVTLPASATVGQVIEINGKGAGLWKLAQNSDQTIHFGSIDTTTGTEGYLAATVRYDCVSVRCITDNTDWVVYSSSGTLTIV